MVELVQWWLVFVVLVLRMFVLYHYLCRVDFGGVSEKCDCGSMNDDRQLFILCSGSFVVLLCFVIAAVYTVFGGITVMVACSV